MQVYYTIQVSYIAVLELAAVQNVPLQCSTVQVNNIAGISEYHSAVLVTKFTKNCDSGDATIPQDLGDPCYLQYSSGILIICEPAGCQAEYTGCGKLHNLDMCAYLLVHLAEMDFTDSVPVSKLLLKERWLNFVAVLYHTVPTDDVYSLTKEKRDRLEEFLHLFLVMAADTTSTHEDLRDFSNDTSSVCNILAREFLSDVHNCCTSSECSNGDTSLLMNYLLHQRGWLLLNALNNLVTQPLSCTADLANLLVALIPLVLKLPTETGQLQRDTEFTLTDISTSIAALKTHQCFQPPSSHKNTTSSRDPNYPPSWPPRGSQRSKQHLKNSRRKVAASPRIRTRQKKENQIEEQNSSDTDDNMASFFQQKRSHSFPMLSHINSEGHMETYGSHAYYKNQMTSSGQDTSMFMRSAPTRPLNIDIKDGKVTTDITSPVDLCLVLLSLLEKLSSSEITSSSSRNSVAISMIPQLIRLSTLLNKFPGCKGEGKPDDTHDVEMEFAEGWEEDTVTVLQRVILRIILKLCAITCLHQNGCSALSNNGTLTSILELAIDINNKLKLSVSEKNDRPLIEGVEDDHRLGHLHRKVSDSFLSHSSYLQTPFGIDQKLSFVCEVLQGLLLLISSIMQNLPVNLTFMSQTLHLLHEFSSSQGYTLYTTAIRELECTLEKLKSTDREYHQVRDFISALISNLTKVMSAVKKAKVEYIHIMTCLKRKHRKCEFSRFMHHHHNVCGLSCLAYEETSHSMYDSLGSFDAPGFVTAACAEKCCIAAAAEVLLRVFENSSCKFTQLTILSNLEMTGICCCMKPDSIISPLLSKLSERPVAVRSYVFNFINKAILEQLGGGVNIPTIGNEACNICSDIELQSNRNSLIGSSTELVIGSYPDNLDSAIGSDASTHDEEQHTKWRVLSKYKDLLLSDDENISVPVAKHLLNLVSHGNSIIKKVLFLQVFLPSFEVTKATTLGENSQRRPSGKELMSMAVLEHCFNALPPLLTSPSAQELFLNHGGLRQLLQLLHHDSTRSSVLRVFEVLIMAEDQRQGSTKKADPYTGEFLENSDGRSFDASTTSSYGDTGISSISSTNSLANFGVINAFLDIITDVISCYSAVHDNLESAPSEEITDKEESVSSATTTETLEFVNSGESSSLFNPSFSERKISTHSLPSQLSSNNEKKIGGSLAVELANRKLTASPLLKAVPLDVSFDKTNLPTFEPSSTDSTLTLRAGYDNRNVILNLSDPELQIAADVWRSCKNLYRHSLVFKEHFLDHNGLSLSQSLLKDAVDALNVYKVKTSESSSDLQATPKRCQRSGESGKDRLSYLLSLLECLLAICLDCAAISKHCVLIQTLSVESELANIKSPLLETGLMKSSHGQELCDALIQSAILQRADPLDITRTAKTPQSSKLSVHFAPLGSDNQIDGSDTQSDTQSDGCVTEGGYDADSEQEIDDKRKGRERPISVNGSGTEEESPQTLLLHPPMCKLVLELLAANVDVDYTDVTCYGLQQLIAIATTCQTHSTALYYDGLATSLLDVFSEYLTSSSKDYQEIQSLVLELFVVLVRHNISSQELQTFIRFMQHKDVPMDLLLCALTNVASNMTTQPSHILCFPTSMITDNVDTTSPPPPPATTDSSHKVPSPVYNDSSNAQRSDAISATILDSPWTIAPLQIPTVDSPTWMPSVKGFSLSMWMRVEGKEDTELTSDPIKTLYREDSADSLDIDKVEPLTEMKREPSVGANVDNDSLHVCSIGSREVLLQIWYNPTTNDLLLRLVWESKDKKDVVLVTKHVSRMLIPGKWQHMAVSYSEKVDGKTTCGTVVLIVDGHHQVDVLMDYRTISLSKQAERIHCLIGHSKKIQDSDHPPVTVWQMSNIMIFAEAVLSAQHAYHLYTLGPDCSTLSRCVSSKQLANYEMSISKDVLDAGLSVDMLTGVTDMDIKPLRESMVVAYSPRNGTVYSLYRQKRQISRSVSIVTILQNSNKSSGTDLSVQQQVFPMQATVLTELVPQIFRGLQNAVYEVGGIAVFIYMFAKVVERCADEVTQAKSLELILLLKSQSQQLAEEFKQLDGYGMVYKVLQSDRCHLGQHMLKVLLDACCHGDTVLKGSPSKGYLTNHKSKAIICDKELVSKLLLSWKLWYNTEVEIWETLLDVFNLLISKDHPYHEFNAKQLQCSKVVEKILLTCKELQSQGLPPPAVSIGKRFIRLVKDMLGSPPDLDTIITICDFLLVVHPAVSTFVCHAPSSFYFTQHSGPQQEYKQRLILSTTPSTANSPGSSVADRQSTRESPSPFTTSTPIKIRKRSRHASIPEISDDGDIGSDPGIISRQLLNVQVIGKSSSFPSREMAIRKLDWSDENGKGKEENKDGVECKEGKGSDAMKMDLLQEVSSAMKHPTCSFYLGGSKDVSEDDVDGTLTGNKSTIDGQISEVLVHKPVIDNVTVETANMLSQQSNDNSIREGDVNKLNSLDRTDSGVVNAAGHSETMSNTLTHTASTGSTAKDDNDTLKEEASSSSSSRRGFKDYVVVKTIPPEDDPDAYLVVPEMEAMSTSQLTDTDGLSITHDSLPPPAGEDGLDVMCTGLMSLLLDVVVTLPENMVGKVIGMIIKPEILVVLAHNISSDIRTAVVKLLDMYFHRASNEQIQVFLKTKGFYLLANQLHQHGATRELIEACLTITVGQPVSLDDDVDILLLQDANKLKLLSVIPTMALMENCVHDAAVCHNTICLLIQFFDVDSMAQVMLDNGLVETLCNVVSAVNKVYKNYEIDIEEEQQLLLGDIEHFLACIVVRSCSLGGLQPFQHLDDLVTMLGILEDKEKEIHGIASEAVRNIRKIRWYVLKEALDHIHAIYSTEADSSVTSKGYHSYSVRKFYEFKQRHSFWQTSSTPDSKIKPMTSPLYPLYDRSYSVEGRFVMPYGHDEILDDEVDSGSHQRVMTHGHLPLSESRRYSMLVDPRKLHKLQKDRLGMSDNEAPQRFQRLIILAVNMILFSDPVLPRRTELDPSGDSFSDFHSDISYLDEERSFIEYLYDLLVDCIATIQERTRGRNRRHWHSLLWSSRDVLRVQLGRLMVHMLSPTQDVAMRCYALNVAHGPKAHTIMKSALQSNLQHDFKVVVYLHDLMTNHSQELNRQQSEDTKAFRAVLEKCAFLPEPLKSQHDRVSFAEDMRVFELELEKNHMIWRRQRESYEKRQLHRLDGLAREISHCAMEVTQKVVMDQNMQRKKLLEEVRHGMAENMDLRSRWHDLVQQLTHERAVWYDPEYFPTSWQLDPTEGPARVRRRLQRCHLGLNFKYLMPEKRCDYQESCKEPLSYLFEDCTEHTDSAVLISRTQTNEAIKNTAKCSNVTPSSETPGELLIGSNNVYFVGDDGVLDSNSTWEKQGEGEVMSLSWSYEDIKEIHRRWYQLRDDGLEIFLTNGKTFLLAFENQKERDYVYKQLLSMDLPNHVEIGNIGANIGAITQAWRCGQMTNFEYLTQLNKIAGRTFNDLMQYPVFPFILADYTSDELNLENNKSFRNLLKPIAVQYKDMESVYIDRYKWLKEEFEKPEIVHGVELMPPTEPHHYGSHYSNSGTVLQYVVRLPPFTKMFLQYQDQHFDLPDRTFHSVGTAWRLSSRESTSDVKELIPEFFFLPEFLTNGERYNFGRKQSGEPVDHVILPPWAKQNPRLFILIHRQALESDYVSQNLHGWVDLVFGLKQKGKSAVEAINVFHPATYFGLDVSSIDDPVKRRAMETMIKTYGQTPRQLFTHPHPHRTHPESSMYPEVTGMYSPGIFSLMATKDANKAIQNKIERPLEQVRGLKWGNYVGSPTAPEPKVCWRENYNTVVAKLVALPTGSLCGLAANVCLFVMYAKEKGVSSIHTTDIEWSAILSWGHPDGVMRLKQKRNTDPINFIHTNTTDQISCCNGLSDCRQFFAGTVSGVVLVYNTKYNPSRLSNIEVVGNRVRLYGHSSAITCLSVCTPYSILASGSQDGTCIIWDLNRLCYIRTLTGHSGPVIATAISDTMGDIATASRPDTGGSDLYLWTINGTLVSHIHCDSVIHSLTFSHAPEGCSVNVIAAGLHTGVVRLWSSWDLKPVREIFAEDFNKPVVSLVFSHDCNFLYAANSEGTVVVWNKSEPGKHKIPTFIPFLK
ncbi:lysosomal-trafficking regulator-like [Glandiceps talaboti]